MGSKVKWTRVIAGEYTRTINGHEYQVTRVYRLGCQEWQMWVDGIPVDIAFCSSLKAAKKVAEQHAAAEQPEAASEPDTNPAVEAERKAKRQLMLGEMEPTPHFETDSSEQYAELKKAVYASIRDASGQMSRDILIRIHGNMTTTAACLLMMDKKIRYVYPGQGEVFYEIGDPDEGEAPIYDWGDILKSIENSDIPFAYKEALVDGEGELEDTEESYRNSFATWCDVETPPEAEDYDDIPDDELMEYTLKQLAASDSETPAESSTHEATRQAAAESNRTLGISRTGDTQGCCERCGVVTGKMAWNTITAEWDFCCESCQVKDDAYIPFADEPDGEGEPRTDEYGIVEDAFYEAAVAGEYQVYRAMYDDALLAGDSALADLVAERETVAAQQKTIEELQVTLRITEAQRQLEERRADRIWKDKAQLTTIVVEQREETEALQAERETQTDLNLSYVEQVKDMAIELNNALNDNHLLIMQIEQLRQRVAELKADQDATAIAGFSAMVDEMTSVSLELEKEIAMLEEKS